MRTENNAFQLAERVLRKAEQDHFKFEDQHEINCRGMFCPGPKVEADIATPS